MLVALIITTVVALFFGVTTLILKNKTNKLLELVAGLNIKIDANSDPVKEDFLKFVSDSREWAFEYIEEVQLALSNFKEKVEPQIEYFDQYGEILSNQRADYLLLKIISDAYKELIIILPESK
jgi:hypothetical protein